MTKINKLIFLVILLAGSVGLSRGADVSMHVLGAKKQTLVATTDTVNAGYYSSTTLHAVDTNLAAGNIKSGVTIFGILGTHEEAGGAPLTPQSLAAVVGDQQITLHWSAPALDGGSAITNYKIYRSLVSGSETFLITVGNVLTYPDTGLTNGVAYYYKVSAVTSIAESSQSNEITTTPATFPSAPQNLGAAGVDTQITLNWSAPASNGGSAITNYKIYRGASSGSETEFTTVGNVLTYLNGSLTNGPTYYYKVSAVNSISEGTQSEEANAAAGPFCTVSGYKNTYTNALSPGTTVYCDNSLKMWTPTGNIGGSATTRTWCPNADGSFSCTGLGAGYPACNYCDSLTYAGYDDWVLPSNDKLYAFGMDACGWTASGEQSSCTPSWDTNAQSSVYWTSTGLLGNYAIVVYFSNGLVNPLYNKSSVGYVRCVRAGP